MKKRKRRNTRWEEEVGTQIGRQDREKKARDAKNEKTKGEKIGKREVGTRKAKKGR